VNEKENPTLVEIKHKLEILKNCDKEFLVSGSTAHKYKSYPESNFKLEHLEGKLGVHLPKDFREFLLEVGSGAGPYSGLIDSDKILAELTDFAYVERSESIRFPDASKPFPLYHEQAEKCFQIMEEEQFASITTGWPVNGFIPICEEGCGYFTCLITAGELVGSLWSTNKYGEVENENQMSWNLAPKPPGIITVHPYNDRDYWENVRPSKWVLLHGLTDFWSNLPYTDEPLWHKALSPLPTFLEWYSAWLDQCLMDFNKLNEKKNEKPL
jgi:hypothetical protein